MAVINPLQFLQNGVIENTPIGQTTPAAGTFTTLTGNSTSQFGRASANYFQAIGAAANLSPELSVLGSDTNIPFTIETKGTGAINLSAGSRGVNVANGQTVTAITRTAAGTGYTSPPTWTASAPTTAGGVQATGTTTLTVVSATLGSGGTGYTVGDVLTVSGGTSTQVAQVTVNTVSGGVIATFTVSTGGNYTVIPSNPAGVTGGTGSGATFNFSWGITSAGFTITNAGSGYVEQPTVSFSGGGGSGAAAYASVGATPSIRCIASNLSIETAAGVGLRVQNSGTTNVNFAAIQGVSSGGSVLYGAGGSDANIGVTVSSFGTGFVRFATNNVAQEQMRISHTASAVNYVQVTGAATGGTPTISAQGSDTNIPIAIDSKGASSTFIRAGGFAQLAALRTASAVNYVTATGSTANNAVVLGSAGNDTNIDLALTPKGTGLVRFGTYTATVSTITGYIEIKDSGGTTRRLAVVS